MEVIFYCIQVDEKMVGNHIKKITSKPPPCSGKDEVTKINELLLKASLDQTLSVSDKILTIIDDKQFQQAVLDVSKQKVLPLDKLTAENSASQKKPEKWAAASVQNPQPDPSPPSVVKRVHMMAEYDHRINKNYIYLSEPWKIQTSVKDMHRLKTMVRYAKTFKDKWPDIISEAKSEGESQRRHPPPEVLKSSRSVIKVLKCYAKVNF